MNAYVYGIVSAGHPQQLDELVGVDAKQGGLHAVRGGEVAAVISDAPPGLRAKRRNLLAHEQVLEALCAQGATLPMRFGMLADDNEALARELSDRQNAYLDKLAELVGRVEMNVKATHQEEALLRSVLLRDPDLRRMNDELRSAGGGSGDERARFGELVAAAVSEQERRDAAVIVEELAGHASAYSDGPAVDGCFVNSSFLVDAAGSEDFESAVDELAEAAGEAVQFRVRGPLPPYSFVTTAETGNG